MEIAIAWSEYSHGEEEDWPIRNLDKREPDHYEKQQKRWLDRLEGVARKVLEVYSTNNELHDQLAELFEYYSRMGFTLTPWLILDRLGVVDRQRAFGLAECLLVSPSAGLKLCFHCLFNEIEIQQREPRFSFMKAAVETKDPHLARSVITGYSWWRKNGLLAQEKVWLLEFSQHATEELFPQWMRWIDSSRKEDWEFSYEIFWALPIDPRRPELVFDALGHAARDAELKPPSELVTKILNRFVSVSKLKGGEIENGVANLARLYPRQLYDFFSSRIRFKESQAKDDAVYEPIGLFIDDIRLPGFSGEPDAKSLRNEAFRNSLARGHGAWHSWRTLLQMAWIRGDEEFPKHVGDQLDQITSAREVVGLAAVLRFNHSRVVLNCPDLVKKFMERAKGFGGDCLEQTTRELIMGIESGGRSFTNGEMDDKTVLSVATELAVQWQKEQILGSFYSRLVESENKWVQSIRGQYLEDDE